MEEGGERQERLWSDKAVTHTHTRRTADVASTTPGLPRGVLKSATSLKLRFLQTNLEETDGCVNEGPLQTAHFCR